MQRSSVYTSLGLHAGVFLAAMISIPWLKKDFVIPESVTVEFVEIAKTRQTDKPAPKPAPKPPEEVKKEETAPPKPKPKPAAQNTSDAPAVPVKKEEVKKEEKKPEKKILVDEKALPDQKKKIDEKKTTTEKPPEKDFASVLRNLEDIEDKPEKRPPEPDLNLDEAMAEEGQNVPLGKQLTMSEEDALRRQLQGCWHVPIGARDAENLIVKIFMVINPDRTLRGAKIVDTGRYNSDLHYRAAADSAMRAVQSPNCSPFDLPPDKYDTWKQTTVTFNPSDMF